MKTLDTDKNAASAQDMKSVSQSDGTAGAMRRPRPSRLLWPLLVFGLLAMAAWPYDQRFSEGVVAARQGIENVLGLPAMAGVVIMPLAILISFPNWRRLVIGFLAPLALASLSSELLKRVVGRARPDEHVGAYQFDPAKAIEAGQFQSFPSGDAMGAIVLALLLGLYFPRVRWIFYVYAGFVGLSRVVLARHFPSDVLAGYVVGLAAVYVCVRVLGPTFYERDLPRGVV